VFAAPNPERPRRDAGFTLLEVLTTLTVFGIAAAIALSGLRAWASALDEQGGAQAIVAELRRAQQESVTEGRAVCVDFAVPAVTYTVYRGACDDPGRVPLRGPASPPRGTRLAAPAFAGTHGVGTGVTFLPRGTAWGGSVRLTRTGAAKVYTITVEPLTGRVSVG
jgi:type II secretion system protein H